MKPTSWLVLAIVLAAGTALLVATDAKAVQAATHGGPHCTVITHRALHDGTENQPEGITHAATYGWAEVDAAVTADGEIAALHDARLGRLTGGHTNANVSEVTYADLWAMPHPYGPFRKTTTLINRAATLDTPIMVTINTWGAIRRAGYADTTLDTLHAAAQAHPHPGWVYFGGFGAQDAMRTRHPDAATFWRYSWNDTNDWIAANAAAEGVDLVALPKRRHTATLVDRLRAIPTVRRVTTRQITTADEARTAQAAGITVMQGNDPELIATEWCK